MRRTITVLTALLALSVPGTGASAQSDGRALALEDYYRLKSVDAPQISPDGSWVTFAVETPIESDNGSAVQAWVVPADGSGSPGRVTHDGADVSDPTWTAEGRLRYETSDGGVWSVDPARASEDPVRIDEDPAEGVVSPDGQWRAVVRPLPVAARQEARLTDFERRHQERFEGVQFDWYPFVRDGEEFPLPDARDRPAEEIFLERLDGTGEARQLTTLGLRADDLSWSADGRSLLFTADEAVLDELAYPRTDLFMVDVDGTLTRLTDDGFTYSGVGFSPDGRWISYVRSWGTDYIIERRLDHGGPRDLYVRSVDGGDPVNLTETFDLDAGTPRWAPDSGHLYFTTGIGGANHLFRVSPDGGEVAQVTTGERRIDDLTIDRSFSRMAYTVGEFERPPEVWTADIDGSDERRLTDVHDDFMAEVATSRAERIEWDSYDGTRIEGFLLYPWGYDADDDRSGADPADDYPLIVVNHGGPHSASGYRFDFKSQLFAANGYFVVLPNFRSSTGYGDDFKWGTWGAWGTKDGEDVLAGIDDLIERMPVDRDRIGTTGHSYGGILTNWLITRYPDRFKAAVSGAGASNWTSNYAHSDVARTKELEFMGRPWEPQAREIMIRQSAYLNSGGVQAATLFVHGEVDYRVPLEGAIQLYTSLKKQRVPAELIVYEGQAHGIRGHWNNVHRMMNELRWWETYLKPRGPVLTSDGS